jgi:hypothetical protein
MTRAGNQAAPSASQENRALEMVYICALAVLIFLGNLPLLFGKTYQDLSAFVGDFFVGVIYGYNALGESLRSGNFPLWGSSMGCGVPEQAVLISGYAYPPAMLFSLLEFPWKLVIFYLTHFELLGIFSFLVFRRLGISRPSSLLAAGWNAMSGYTIWISMMRVEISTLPWFFLMVFLLLDPAGMRRMKNFLLLALALAMMVLAGDPEEMVYAGLFGGIFLGCFWALSEESFPWKSLALLLLALGLAVMIAMDQVLPTLNYLQRTVRAGKPPYQLYLASYFQFGELARGVLGLFFRGFYNLYFSFLAAVFGVWGLWAGKKSAARTAGIVLLLLMMAILLLPGLGLGKIIYHLPLYSHFIRHYKLGYLFQFLVLLFAGMGLDRFLELVYSRKPSLQKSAWATAGFALVLMLDAYSYLWHPPYKFFKFQMPGFWPEYVELARASEGKNRIQVFYPALSILAGTRPRALPLQVIGYPGGEGFDFYVSYPLKNYSRFLALLNPELEKPARNLAEIYNYSQPLKSRDYINARNRHLLNMVGLRWLFLENFSLAETERRSIIYDPRYFLNPERPEAFGGYQVREFQAEGRTYPWLANRLLDQNCGPNCFLTRLQFNYQADFYPGDELFFRLRVQERPATFSLWAQSQEQWQMLLTRTQVPTPLSEVISVPIPEGTQALRFVMERQGLADAGWVAPEIRNGKKSIKYVKGDNPQVFENREAMPRGWIVHQASFIAGDEKLALVLGDGAVFDPRQRVLLSSRFNRESSTESPLKPGKEEVQLEQYGREKVSLRASLETPGWLVWMDQYYPGWQAEVDGQEQRIWRANLCFRALALPAGEHELVFRFRPLDFEIGLYAALIGWLCLGAGFLRGAFQRTRSSS